MMVLMKGAYDGDNESSSEGRGQSTHDCGSGSDATFCEIQIEPKPCKDDPAVSE